MEIVIHAEFCEVAADFWHAVINKTWLFHKQYIYIYNIYIYNSYITYPQVIKQGLMENPPFSLDFPSELNLHG